MSQVQESLEQKYPDWYWLNEESLTFLRKDYLLPGVTAKERVEQIAQYAEKILGVEGFAERFIYHMKRGHFSLSSPVWANFGLERGLAISCFGSWITDSIEGILDTVAEVGVMNKFGGGTSGYFGAIRPRGSLIKDNGKSNGSFEFLNLFETTTNVISQGNVRRGMFAGWQDIEHADVEEWLNIHTEGNPIQQIYYGITVSDKWLEEMKAGDKHKRNIWAKIIQRRTETGIPYIMFSDNVNENKPDVYKDKNLRIYASNMCNEIALPSKEDESFVCCLMSVNLLHYDSWKDTDAVQVATYFLDAVMSEFIQKAKNIKYMERAVNFAERHRALGLGVLGWHSFLQSKMIPFDSFQAMQLNNQIFKYIKDESYKASATLAGLLGEPELLKGYGRRHATTMAIAPTKSSSFILGQVSPSIEPYKSNYYVKDLAKTKTVFKNPYLEKLLQEKGLDMPDIWKSILDHGGSVQHLNQLTQVEKDVFKTFEEISQLVIIQQAAQRQAHIDQGQSLNVMIHPKTPAKDINQLYLTAHELGVKGLYYQFSTSAAQDLNRSLLTGCSSCEA